MNIKTLLPTMAISNCLFSPTSENLYRFSAWCVLAKLSAKPRNYSQPRPLATIERKGETENPLTEQEEGSRKLIVNRVGIILKSYQMDKQNPKRPSSDLSDIKDRLRKGKLTAVDIKQLEQIIVDVELAAAKLRAAVVE